MEMFKSFCIQDVKICVCAETDYIRTNCLTFLSNVVILNRKYNLIDVIHVICN